MKVDFINLIKSYNFRYLINDITYVRNESHSCIDNLLTNLSDNSFTNTTVDYNGLSDGHAAIMTQVLSENFNQEKWKQKYISVEKRIFNAYNNRNFRQSLKKVKWLQLGINDFLHKFSDIFRKSFRKKIIKTNIRNNGKLKWVTKGIRVSSKMKRILCTLDNNHNHVSLYNYRKKYINIYRKVIRHSKTFTVQNSINNCKNSNKEIWKVVNKYRNNKFSTIHEKIILKSNNITIKDPKEIIEMFSNKFNCSKKINTTNIQEAMAILHRNGLKPEKNIEFRQTTVSEVTSVVKKMENKNSSGYDDMPSKIIKDNIDILAEPLSYLFNACINQGIFPDQLKISKIIPVHKKLSKSDVNNYRPIALPPILSKIFEKLIKVQLMTHLNTNKLLNGRQFGYQKGVGTSDAIDTMIDDITRRLNEKLKVAGIFLDLSSAFDTIDHDVLINKIHYYGVTDKSLSLLKSYLSNRKQFVEIVDIDDDGMKKSYKSALAAVTRGVPQGSVLGPIFFIIFLNDLINYMYNLFFDIGIVIFADDTNAVISGNNVTDLSNKTNAVMTAFNTWFSVNNLILNTSKTNVMVFKTTVRNNQSLSIHVNGVALKIVETMKFLGIYLDSLLNWKAEVSAVDDAISSACYALRTLREELTENQLLTIYYALVESRLRYSIKFWGNSYKYNTNRAFIAQKRAIRAMVHIPPWESCAGHFRRLKILTVPSLYIHVLLIDLIKNRHLYESEDRMKQRLITRRMDLQKVIIPTFNIVQHCPRNQAVVLFNKLPRELKSLNDLNIFRTKLKSLLLERCLYSIDEF